MAIEKQVHYGHEVWTNTQTDATRKTNCLCLACDQMGKCSIASALYAVCKDRNVALMVTRCPEWVAKN